MVDKWTLFRVQNNYNGRTIFSDFQMNCEDWELCVKMMLTVPLQHFPRRESNIGKVTCSSHQKGLVECTFPFVFILSNVIEGTKEIGSRCSETQPAEPVYFH